jgi:hypothetical protein
MDFVTVKATAICGREQQQDENLMKNIWFYLYFMEVFGWSLRITETRNNKF